MLEPIPTFRARHLKATRNKENDLGVLKKAGFGDTSPRIKILALAYENVLAIFVSFARKTQMGNLGPGSAPLPRGRTSDCKVCCKMKST